MPNDLLYPDDIDFKLNWPNGRTSRLALCGKLPHYILPDGSIRLRWAEVALLIQQVAVAPDLETEVNRG